MGFKVPLQCAKRNLMCGRHQRSNFNLSSTIRVHMLCLKAVQESHFSPTDNISLVPEAPSNLNMKTELLALRNQQAAWWRTIYTVCFELSCSNQSMWGEYTLCYCPLFQLQVKEMCEKSKNKDKNFQKIKGGTGNIANFLRSGYFLLFAGVLWLCQKALLTCFFTDDYSKNKIGSQTSRAWDLHEAKNHLWDQCCHFVDQAMQIDHARFISFAKKLSEVSIHWAIFHRSKSGYHYDGGAEWQ